MRHCLIWTLLLMHDERKRGHTLFPTTRRHNYKILPSPQHLSQQEHVLAQQPLQDAIYI